MEVTHAIRALASEPRLQILEWLKNPRANFRRQTVGSRVKDGVCGVLIAEKLGVTQPTASVHLRVLTHAGLIRPKRMKQWTLYKRDEAQIRKIRKAISAVI